MAFAQSGKVVARVLKIIVESAEGRTRTADLDVMNVPLTPANAGANEPCPHQSPHSVAEPPADPDLSAVVSAWPMLPPAIRAAVLMLVKAAGTGGVAT